MRSVCIVLILGTHTGFVSACQTTTSNYYESTITSRPSSSNYNDSDKFVLDSMVYTFPRGCVYFTTADGARISENQKPGKFSISSIIENKYKDGWYVGYMNPVFLQYNALSFYFNKDNGDYSCGDNRTRKGANISFKNGRWLDLASLEANPKQPAPEVKRASSPSTSQQSPPKTSIQTRLKELKKLNDSGLITSDEAVAKRKEILEGL